jgi:hypothetical protein
LLNIKELGKTERVLGTTERVLDHRGEIMTGEREIERRVAQTEMNGKKTAETM